MADDIKEPVEGYDPNATSRFAAIGASSQPAPALVRPLLPEEITAIESLPVGSAFLIAQSGPNVGARFLLDAPEILAGRHNAADVFLDDATVSRRHVFFLRDDEGGYWVRDAGSLNGTYVNRERIDEVKLRTGDEVQIGKFRLVFYASQTGE